MQIGKTTIILLCERKYNGIIYSLGVRESPPSRKPQLHCHIKRISNRQSNPTIININLNALKY